MGTNGPIEIPLHDIALNELLLRNFVNLTAEEAVVVLSMRNADFVREWLFHDKVISASDHQNFLTALKTDNRHCYFLAKRAGAYLGVVSLNRIDRENLNSYLGIYKNPTLQEKGTGAILMDCLIHLAFRILGLHTLKLEVLLSNTRAISLYAKFGFQQEGILRELILRRGEWRDVVVMGLINQEQTGHGNRGF